MTLEQEVFKKLRDICGCDADPRCSVCKEAARDLAERIERYGGIMYNEALDRGWQVRWRNLFSDYRKSSQEHAVAAFIGDVAA